MRDPNAEAMSFVGDDALHGPGFPEMEPLLAGTFLSTAKFQVLEHYGIGVIVCGDIGYKCSSFNSDIVVDSVCKSP